jgi:cytochrome c oxidase subunit IV
MSETAPGTNPYRIYWITWGLLLMITVAMLAAEAFHLPRIFLVLFLLTFMTVKAAMIGGNFMHLRFERRNLSLMVSVGILLTSLILYTFITPESWHVKATSAPAPEPAPAAHAE